MRKTPALLAAGLALTAASCYRDFDFSGDGKADYVAVGATGTWENLATAATVRTGTGTDIPVPGDWDNDHNWDAAVVQGSNWVTNTDARGTIVYAPPAVLPAYASHFSLTSIPVPGDYDGDGDLDPAWYREADGRWFIQDQPTVQFGNGPSALPGAGTLVTENDYDFPVPADYDGDLVTDLAVYNPVTGSYRVRASSTGTVSTVTMTANASYPMPAPGDYAGAGHAQRAVFGPAGWEIEGQPLDLFGAASEGETGYPAAGDFDGDNDVDRAYVGWDTSNWYTEDSATVHHVDNMADEWPLEMGYALRVNLARLNLLGFCHDEPGAC